MGLTLISGFGKAALCLRLESCQKGLKTSSGGIGWNIQGIYKAGNFSWEFKGIIPELIKLKVSL